jgi:hypothetical protein
MCRREGVTEKKRVTKGDFEVVWNMQGFLLESFGPSAKPLFTSADMSLELLLHVKLSTGRLPAFATA